MENYSELKPDTSVILDEENYGMWKSKTRSIIRGIDAMAWKTVVSGWSEPTTVNEAGIKVRLPEEDWTKTELKMARYNSIALSKIHSSVTDQNFDLIQGCETTKEAWDILQTHCQGTSKVHTSRKDILASRFENLRMEKRDSIGDFSSRIKVLAQEALDLGKKYKEKKLVKKFLRCLPEKYTAYKAAMSVSLNTDEISFDEVVGMFRVHEMELKSSFEKRRGKALMSHDVIQQDEEVEDPVSRLVKRFDRALRRLEQEQSQKQFVATKSVSDTEESGKKVETRCSECKGYGHLKAECPTIRRRKIKCCECRGFGHTQLECVNHLKHQKENLQIGDSEEDSEEEDEVNHFVTFLGIAEFEEGEEVSESESEGDLS